MRPPFARIPVRGISMGLAALTSTVAASALPASPAHAVAGPPAITAKGAYLLDSSAHRALWGRAVDTERPMASTTKMMTAALILNTKGVNLDRLVTVKQAYRDYAVRNGASSADLRTGDKVTVRQLLYALLLPSGCDAAYALADTFGHGTSMAARTMSFVSAMNGKAKTWRLTRTRFDSFDGISPTGATYSTPRDLAELARRAMANAVFRTVVKSASTVQRATDGRRYTWYNTNLLLGSYPGAIGIKTGTGTAAGKCLVFAVVRGGRVVTGVVLGDENRFTDAVRMLNWAYGQQAANALLLRLPPKGAPAD